ncbi:RHD3-domain-containing protein [Lichtheimia hyalospora FSU 10163]|nr:RHD3-domain-containing protein [Lichtheimia hyalospora FSU 10163]
MRLDTYADDTDNTDSVVSIATHNHYAKTCFSQLQIVNNDHQFIDEIPDNIIEQWALGDAGTEYHVVSAFGTRGCGKSTLLNRLFGTAFTERKPGAFEAGTKGLWISRAQNKSVLVMDAQGLDDYDFDCKSTLFLMVSSSVLIFNIWEHQVGLNVGANMDLLRLVIELKLQIDPSTTQRKPMILIIVRDHEDDVSLTAVRKTMDESLENVWRDVNKPENLKGSQLRDYFDFMVTALPHKKLQAAEFNRRVKKLRERVFDDPHGPNYAFKSSQQLVPIDGYLSFAMSMWMHASIATYLRSNHTAAAGNNDISSLAIIDNPDINDQSQHKPSQELYANHVSMDAPQSSKDVIISHHHNCIEIFNKNEMDLDERINRLRSRVILEGRVIANLDQQVERVRRKTKDGFDETMHECVYGSCRTRLEELLSRIESNRREIYQAQLDNLHKAVYERFVNRITPFTKQVVQQNQMIPDIGRRMRDIRDQEMRTYDTKAAQSYLAGIHEARRKDLLDKIHSQFKTICAHQLKILRTASSSMFEENLRAKLNQGMNLELAVAKCKAQVVDYFMNGAKATVAIDDSNWSNSYYDHWISLEQDLAKICARVHQEIKSDSSIDGVLDTLFEVVIGCCTCTCKAIRRDGLEVSIVIIKIGA